MQDTHNSNQQSMHIAEAVRQLCLQAAIEAYEEAGFDGLCAEGRWDYAVDAIRRVDLTGVAALSRQTPPDEVDERT